MKKRKGSDMGIEYAVNGDVRIAYETFGTAGEPLLLVSGSTLHPERIRGLTLCMSSPATAGPLRTLRYLKFGVFREFRKLPKATTPEQEIDNLIAIYRAQASPGYPFPEEWVRETATLSHRRAPRDPGTTQRHLAAGRATKLPPLSAIEAPTLVVSGADDQLLKPSAGRDLAAQIPGAEFVVYLGVGHDLPEGIWDDVIARMPRAATIA
jgi:pimeloyl-ACP methyl ester carboxylesterase